MGGALGLFLGWSCLDILVDLIDLAIDSCASKEKMANAVKIID